MIYKVKMRYWTDEGEVILKNLYLNVTKITSFYMEEEAEDGVKYLGITCGGDYFSVFPDAHIYDFLFENFISISNGG